MFAHLVLPLSLGASLLAMPPQGEIDPVLRAALQHLRGADQTTVLVHLQQQVPLPALVARLDRMQATRQFRHELVVRSLRDLAKATQPPVLRVLQELQAIDEVSTVVPFWLWNGFAVRGTRGAIERLLLMPEIGQLLWAGADVAGTDDALDADGEVAPAPILPTVPGGLRDCRADFLWNLGFTGQNVLVAHIDTGVDGTHPALQARWRGASTGVAAGAAWFDPVAGTTFPYASDNHGTATMGTLCGDDGLGNRIGMAPGARWIASNVINALGTRAQKNVWYCQAIQWIADPDSDPSTVTDVPDVCNNSWGVRDPANGVGPCSTVFDAAIDAAEASTVALVFGAGNDGVNGPRVPADRATSPTNTFAVGALLAGSTGITFDSSLGPTTCPGPNQIKPEVAARGTDVHTSVPGGYALMQGTSMAAPHIAGAVALLRDVWSELTVPRAKELLLENGVDLGAAGEDNTCGHGRIDLQRAYAALIAERPRVAVSVMGTREFVRVGQTTWPHIVLSNYSASAEVVTLSIEVWIDHGPTGLYFLPPTSLLLPAGFHNRTAPLPLAFPIPAGLDPYFLHRPIEVRGVVQQGTATLSAAGYEFVITP